MSRDGDALGGDRSARLETRSIFLPGPVIKRLWPGWNTSLRPACGAASSSVPRRLEKRLRCGRSWNSRLPYAPQRILVDLYGLDAAERSSGSARNSASRRTPAAA